MSTIPFAAALVSVVTCLAPSSLLAHAVPAVHDAQRMVVYGVDFSESADVAIADSVEDPTTPPGGGSPGGEPAPPPKPPKPRP